MINTTRLVVVKFIVTEVTVPKVLIEEERLPKYPLKSKRSYESNQIQRSKGFVRPT